MFGSAIVDVAIGIIFVYLLLSLICSAINEMIEAKLKNRAKDLETGIRNLLESPALSKQFYDHPLIKALFLEQSGKPSYIPSRTFALAVLNILAPDGFSASAISGGAATPDQLQSLRDKISGLSVSDAAAPIKNAILALIDDAQGDVKKLRRNLENWYDAAMDRVAGWYKRRVQSIILLLGLTIAVSLNADSAYIARHLSNDPPLRNSLVAAAQIYAQRESNEKPEVSPGGPSNSGSAAAKTRFGQNLTEIKKLGLPIGWSLEGNDEHLTWPGLRFWHLEVRKAWYGQIRFHWLGWVLTAFAISLGAPFWFDLLNKFVVVRSTVKPREKSQEEQSKD